MALVVLTGSVGAHAQRIAIVAPETGDLGKAYSSELTSHLAAAEKIRIIDTEAAEPAFRALEIEHPFNMSVRDAKRAADAIGCDLLLLLKVGTTRRTSLELGDYFEAFAAAYLVSGRTGKLELWDLKSIKEGSAETASARLLETGPSAAASIAASARLALKRDVSREPEPNIERIPDPGAPEARGFRPPAPYRRIKPEYTDAAFIYGVQATVDIEADIGADGQVLGTSVVRWAGFGLDESAAEAVRRMNWRPAERAGRALPVRVLLRYNFTKADRE